MPALVHVTIGIQEALHKSEAVLNGAVLDPLRDELVPGVCARQAVPLQQHAREFALPLPVGGEQRAPGAEARIERLYRLAARPYEAALNNGYLPLGRPGHRGKITLAG